MKSAIGALLVFLCFVPASFAEDSEAAALAEVYARLRAGDREGASQTLAEAIPRHPSSVELRALSIDLLTRRDGDRAWDLAQQLRHAHPESPWSWYAVASAGMYTGLPERLAAGREAADKMEALADEPLPEMMLRLKISTLIRQGQREEALAFLGQRDDAVGLQLRGYVTGTMAATNENASQEAAALYERALEAAPDDVRIGAPYVHALASMNSALAIESGRELVAKAPQSASAREAYWSAIHRERETPAEERAAAISADIEQFLQGNDSLEAVQTASNWYRRIENNDRSLELDQEIVRRFPDTPEAQLAMFRLTFRDRWTPTTDPEVFAERRRTIQTFLDYPYHPTRTILGAVYRQLMQLNRTDPAIEDDEYLQAIDAVIAYVREPHVAKTGVAEALAERGLRLETAEKLAREGLEETPRMYEADRATMPNYDEFETQLRGLARGVLGFVLMKRGKLEEAGRELTAAAEENPSHAPVLFYLGSWQEKTGDLEAAELTYARGMAHESKTDSKNLAALEALHQRRKDSAKNFEKYAADLRKAGSLEEKRKVLATRLVPPKTVAHPFDLKTLDGGGLSFADVKGRVTVVNFWGLWCRPCVVEMPYVQELHKRYAGDPGVRILTINNDSNPKKVQAWMEEHGYTFPVLLDDGFVDRSNADIPGFPTSWFLDAEGRIAFVKTGSIHNLVEEFSWRIEALKSAEIAGDP